MSLGQGSTGYDSLKNPPAGPPGPPFVATSADNGLSVDPVSGRIVLGQAIGEAGDPAQLLSNREIPLKGFSFVLGEAADQHLTIDPTLLNYAIGDISTNGNGSRISINDALEHFRIETATELALFIAPQTYSFGNVGDTLNGSKISIDDTNDSFAFRSLGNGRMMSLQGFNSLYRIGDIDSMGNDTQLSINDASQYIAMGNSAGEYLSLDIASDFYSIGDDFGVTNGTAIGITNGTGRIVMKSLVNGSPSSNVFQINALPNIYAMGDLDNDNNGLAFRMDDTTGKFEIDNAAHNSLVRINGTDGFTGTVLGPVTITVIGGIVTNVA